MSQHILSAQANILIEDLVSAALASGKDRKGRDLVHALKDRLKDYLAEVESMAQTEHVLPRLSNTGSES